MTRRVAVVTEPVREYCRHVLRGVFAVSEQPQWECIQVQARATLPLAGGNSAVDDQAADFHR
jgi:hypothetical protein